MKILLLLFYISNIFSEDSAAVDKEVNKINELMQEVEEEIKLETKQIIEAEKKLTELNKENENLSVEEELNEKTGNEIIEVTEEKIKETPKAKEQKKAKKEKENIIIDELIDDGIIGKANFAGKAGSWLFNILYESADYKTGKRKSGAEIEFAWVYDLTYVAFHALSNVGYYGGSESKRGFFPIGLGGEILIGLPSTFFLSSYYGYEYTKQEANDFYLFTKLGFALYFNISNLNKEAQFRQYKNHGIRRTYLVMKYNKRNTTEIETYSDSSISIGFGFEY